MNTLVVDTSNLMNQAQRPAERAAGGTDARRVAGEAQSQRPVQAAVPSQEMRKELDNALQRIAARDTRLSFQVDDDSGRTVITVRDASTSEVLKQIPSEEMLTVARRLEAHLSESADGSGVLLADEV